LRSAAETADDINTLTTMIAARMGRLLADEREMQMQRCSPLPNRALEVERGQGRSGTAKIHR
jgi:hypothetical protein